MKAFVWSAVALALSATAAQAQINQVSYASLTGTQVTTFDDVPGNANYDGIFYSNGVGFAERFVGQTLSTAGGFDTLGGAPSGGSLTLQVGAANQNLSILVNNGTNVLTGLGVLGYPASDAIGEGSFAALFSTDQSQFGFQLVGGDSGSAFVSFFRANGSLIQTINLSNLSNAFYGFQRVGGVKDIRGISIYNRDPAGIGFDNLKFDVQSTGGAVPEPATWALMILGFGAVGHALRRRKVAFGRQQLA